MTVSPRTLVLETILESFQPVGAILEILVSFDNGQYSVSFIIAKLNNEASLIS